MKRAVHLAAWMLLALVAFLLLPERWGGSMTYVVTNGNSMAPEWEAGDLAILRASDDYRVGDVAAFESDDIKRIVMHRIVAVDEQAGTYRFQGDNNPSIDSEVVPEARMRGKLLLRIPDVGAYLAVLLKPLNLMLIAGSTIMVIHDRRKQKAARRLDERPSCGRLMLRTLDLPSTAVTAEVGAATDLDRVAASLGRPVLEIEGDDRRYVVDGIVVYTWSPPAQSATVTQQEPDAQPAPVALPKPRCATSPAAPVTTSDTSPAPRPAAAAGRAAAVAPATGPARAARKTSAGSPAKAAPQVGREPRRTPASATRTSSVDEAPSRPRSVRVVPAPGRPAPSELSAQPAPLRRR